MCSVWLKRNAEMGRFFFKRTEHIILIGKENTVNSEIFAGTLFSWNFA